MTSPLAPTTAAEALFVAQPARGKCHVMCFSPRHDMTVAEMSVSEVEGIVDAWVKLYVDLSKGYPWLKYIQEFENRGAIQGCSNPHPHGQCWSLDYIPNIPKQLYASQRKFALESAPEKGVPTLEVGKPCLLLTYASAELAKEERVVFRGEHFVALVPYWAFWPYEVLILPYR